MADPQTQPHMVAQLTLEAGNVVDEADHIEQAEILLGLAHSRVAPRFIVRRATVEVVGIDSTEMPCLLLSR
ncbi:MAG: hypothetical protein R3D25_17585 [Geminicoccaceae bacterium]